MWAWAWCELSEAKWDVGMCGCGMSGGKVHAMVGLGLWQWKRVALVEQIRVNSRNFPVLIIHKRSLICDGVWDLVGKNVGD